MDDAEIWVEYEKWQCDYYGNWHVCHDEKEPASDADHAQPPKKRAKGNAAASKKEQQKPGRKPKVVSKHNTKQSQKVTKIKESKASGKKKKKKSDNNRQVTKIKESKASGKKKKSDSNRQATTGVTMTDDERAFYERSISKAIKFINKIDYTGLELDDMKAVIKHELPALGITNLMMYWGRPAVTVRKRCGRGWIDVGYISFTGSYFPDTTHCLLLTMSVAIALQLVSRLFSQNTFSHTSQNQFNQ